MVDCTAFMDRVRWIKTDEEVALIRRRADLLDDAYQEAFSRIRPGDTERKVDADIIGTCLRPGFEWAHGIFNVFRNTVRYGGESDMVIEKGDAIRTDYVGYLLGYPGHQSRTVVGASWVTTGALPQRLLKRLGQTRRRAPQLRIFRHQLSTQAPCRTEKRQSGSRS